MSAKISHFSCKTFLNASNFCSEEVSVSESESVSEGEVHEEMIQAQKCADFNVFSRIIQRRDNEIHS